ncbi:MAG: hypothetical protein SGJ20_17320 [Planctomycetota bacterium]|nr:hypothetical protein [Planctomycetota bacterium]
MFRLYNSVLFYLPLLALLCWIACTGLDSLAQTTGAPAGGANTSGAVGINPATAPAGGPNTPANSADNNLSGVNSSVNNGTVNSGAATSPPTGSGVGNPAAPPAGGPNRFTPNSTFATPNRFGGNTALPPGSPNGSVTANSAAMQPNTTPPGGANRGTTAAQPGRGTMLAPIGAGSTIPTGTYRTDSLGRQIYTPDRNEGSFTAPFVPGYDPNRRVTGYSGTTTIFNQAGPALEPGVSNAASPLSVDTSSAILLDPRATSDAATLNGNVGQSSSVRLRSGSALAQPAVSAAPVTTSQPTSVTAAPPGTVYYQGYYWRSAPNRGWNYWDGREWQNFTPR